MKENLPWFKHTRDARNSPGAKALIAQYGYEGYGRFTALLEIMADQPGARLDLSLKKNRSAYAGELRYTPNEFDAFLAYLSNADECGLIYYENGIAWSDYTDQSYRKVEKKRNEDREDYNTRKGKDVQNTESGNGKDYSDTGINTEQSRVEQSREEQHAREGLPVDNLAQETKHLGLMLPRKDLELLALRMATHNLDIGFLAFCGRRVSQKRGTKNPRALLKQTLLEYDDAAEEYLAERSQKAPTRFAPDPGPCPGCGESLKTDTHLAVARCPTCGLWLEYDFKTERWREGAPV